MPDDIHRSVRKKVESIFTELAGDRSRMLDGGKFPSNISATISAALSGPEATRDQIRHAARIAFHLTDWNSDAAFIVALHLFPERFTAEEIEAGIGLFLCHAPHHIIAAARLSGNPAEDVFQEEDEVV